MRKVTSKPGATLLHKHSKLAFDFVVHERPKYIPGSGPPLAPIGIMPLHDKDGVIEEEVTLHGQLYYVVTYHDSPGLRMSVKPQRIGDYVSARTIEQYEDRKRKYQEELEEEEKNARLRARMEKKRAKEAGAETETESRGDPEPGTVKKKPGRSFKNKNIDSIKNSPAVSSPLSGPGRRNKPVEQPSTYVSPKKALQATPSKPQRGLAEQMQSDQDQEMSEDESDDDSTALDRQLNGSTSTFHPTITYGPANPNKRSTRSSSASSDLREDSHDSKRRRRTRSPLDDSTASISSLGALKEYEKLEKSTPRSKGHFNKYLSLAKEKEKEKLHSPPSSKRKHAPGIIKTSTTPAVPSRLRESRSASRVTLSPIQDSHRRRSERSSSSRQTPNPAMSAPPKSKVLSPSPEEEVEEEGYDVECILDEDTRLVAGGKTITYYLLKWAGDWDDTWEPEENIGRDVIEIWKKEKKRKESIKKGKRREIEAMAEREEEEVESEGDEDEDEDGDGDELD